MAGHTQGQFSFGPQDRLHRPGEYAAVMASRSRRFNGCFEVRFRTRAEADPHSAGTGSRLGLMVPKRFAKQAVLRNLLKRLAREAFRDVRCRLPSVDVVLRLTKPPLPTGMKPDVAMRRIWRCNIDELLAVVAKGRAG